MPSRHLTILLILMLPLLLLGGLWILVFDEPADPDLEGRGTPAEPRGSGVVVSPEGGRIEEAPSASPKTIETVPFRPEDDDVAASLGAPIVPEYGPLLERGRSKLSFQLQDARGEALDSRGWSRVRKELFRREGSWWQSVDVHFDSRKHRLLAGHRGHSLEPGDYELEVAAGSYGKIKTSFSVDRSGADRELFLRFPGYRRIVTLVFVDQDGNAIPYLPNVPRFECATTEIIRYRRGAPEVLRDPPGRMNHGFGMGGSSSSRRRYRTRNTRFPTDEGRYYLPVVAGREGKLLLDLDRKLFKTKNVRIKSDFDGPEWNAYEIVLERQEKYDEVIARYKTRTGFRPGNRKVFEEVISEKPVARGVKNPHDPETLGRRRWRMIVELEAPEGIEPVTLRNKRHKERLDLHSRGVWYGDYYLRKWEMSLGTSDGRFYRGPREVIPEGKARTITKLRRVEAAAPLRLSLSSSPTLAAWARGVSFCFRARNDRLLATLPFAPEQAPAERDGIVHSYDSYLSPEWSESLAEWAKLVVCFGSKPSSLLRCTGNGQFGTGGGRTNVWHLALDSTERKEVAAGLVDLDLATLLSRGGERNLLTFRCVGARDEGLSWVEASVIPARKVELVERMRSLARRLDEDDARPNVEKLLNRNAGEGEVEIEIEEIVLDSDNEQIPPPVSSLPTRTPEELKAFFGEELWKLYGPDALARLFRYGAWYDTRSKFRGDDDGYVVTRRPVLVPGELYVLYLWGKSRHDLEPDRRIVFRATKGITDLGLIRMNSH